jgi:outer membrane protein assembly factor BamB
VNTIGIEKWSTSFLTGPYPVTPAVGDGAVYLAVESRLVDLDVATGTVKWSWDSNSFGAGSPAIGADGTLYVASYDGSFHALDGGTGAEKWVFNGASVDTGTPAIGADGTVYVGTATGLFALDGATGAARWSYDAGGYFRASPAIGADGTLYAAASFTDGGVIFALGP